MHLKMHFRASGGVRPPGVLRMRLPRRAMDEPFLVDVYLYFPEGPQMNDPIRRTSPVRWRGAGCTNE
jgi:hypothetical protein